MKKRATIVTIILVVLAVVAIVILLLMNAFKGSPISGEIKPEKVPSVSIASGFALQKTDIDNIYYSMDETGIVRYFEYNEGNVTEIKESGIRKLTVDVSGQPIPINISYVERDGVIRGYGLFVNDKAHRGDVQINFFDYIFFKMCNLPPSHRVDPDDVLILGDEDKDDFFHPNQVYEYMYYYDMKTEKLTRFFDEYTNSTDITGKKRSDYTMMTDDIFRSSYIAKKDVVPFFTSRNYPTPISEIDPQPEVDLYVKKGGSVVRHTYKMDYFYASQTNDGIVFIRKTDNGFNIINFQNKEEKILLSLDGDFENDYVRFQDWLYSKGKGTLIELTTGKVTELPATNITNVKHFTVAKGGTRIALGGEPLGRSGVDMLAFYEVEGKGTRTMIQKTIFSETFANFSFANDDVLFYNAPGEETKYVAKFIKWENIFNADVIRTVRGDQAEKGSTTEKAGATEQ